jgi:hypothetical protein
MLKTITQITALAGLTLTGYGFVTNEFTALQSFVQAVIFVWAYLSLAHQIEI